MPSEIFITYSKDQPDLIEVNQFAKFFTFQIAQKSVDGQEDNSHSVQEQLEANTVEARFTLPGQEAQRFMIRLRSELSTALSDDIQQGMQVSLIEADSNKIVEQRSTFENNEGIVYLEYAEIKPNVPYILRTEFFDKELISNEVIKSSNGCKLPFITQQLLIIDEKLSKVRIDNWENEQLRNPQKDILKLGLDCQFDKFNNTYDLDLGEEGVFCSSQSYVYPGGKALDQALRTTLKPYPRRVSSKLLVLYEHPFEVRGIHGNPTTYWYQMTVGFNLMVSGGLKVLLSRNDHLFDPSNPYSCLYDKSCAEATLISKNQLRLDIILTSGLYKIVMLESGEGPSSYKPIAFSLEAIPVIQKEERVNCPFMFLERDFIQRKFIAEKKGAAFTYSDAIILNLFNLSTIIDITPEVDSLIKIRVKEAYGVNSEIVMCEKEDCLTSSSQIGTTEVMIAHVLKGHTYEIELSFLNSLIEISNSYQCPHIPIEVSMIPVQDLKRQKKCTGQESFNSDSILGALFKNMTSVGEDTDSSDGYVYLDSFQVFTMQVGATQESLNNNEITSKKFIAHQRMQLLVEIFYEPYLYDLELSLFSVKRESSPNGRVDWTLYKGAKSLFVELEPGEYELKIIQKTPSWGFEIPISQPDCVEFQLLVIYSDDISHQHVMPHSLNYLGLMNPIGQKHVSTPFVYICPDCLFEEEVHYKVITFQPDKDLDLLIQLSSSKDSLEIILEEITKETLKEQLQQRVYFMAFEDPLEKGKLIANGMESQFMGGESVISKKLKGGLIYRLILQLKNFDDGELDASELDETRFSLRIETSGILSQSSSKDVVPQSIDEIVRYKIKTEGMKEQEFLIGSKEVLQWIDQMNMAPFMRKSPVQYQITGQKNNGVVTIIKFIVAEEEAQIFVALYDYTPSSANRLGLMISRDDPTVIDDLDWSVQSVSGKSYSYIVPISLTKGEYYISIITQTSSTKKDQVYKFSLDFIYQHENVMDKYQEFMLNSIEMCDGPQMLPRTLNQVEYLHSLNGNEISTILYPRINDLLQGQSIDFKVSGPSIASFYIELPKEIQAEIILGKNSGTKKLIANTQQLNDDQENFLKVKGFKHMNVIQIREQVIPSEEYFIRVRPINSIISFEKDIGGCQVAKFGIDIQPLASGSHSKLGNDKCESLTGLGNKLIFAKHQRGTLRYDLGSAIIDTTYIKTEDQGEGPFFFYFSASYDISYEGVLGLALYKYDPESLQFNEVQKFSGYDGISQISTKIDEGTFVLLIESITSTPQKYSTQTHSKTSLADLQLVVVDPCLTINYSYYISSTYEFDTQKIEMSFLDLISSFLSGPSALSSKMQETQDQKQLDYEIMQQLGESVLSTCVFDELPLALKSDTYDQSFNVMIGQEPYETIELEVLERSYFKLLLQSNNPKDNINVFLYDSKGTLIANTEPNFGYKTLSAWLQPEKKSYTIKIVYDSSEWNEACPMYRLRIAQKPLKLLLSDESLKCSGELPQLPTQILIPADSLQGTQTFLLEKYYQVSINEILKNTPQRGSTHDIEISTTGIPKDKKKRQLYFDLESSFSFDTSDLEFKLHQQGAKVKSLGNSKLLFNENEEDSQVVVKSLKAQSKLDSSKYILRITYAKNMINFAKTLQKETKSDICFGLSLSLKVSASQTELESEFYEPEELDIENELVRVSWSAQGTFNSHQKRYFDPRNKMTAILKFKQSVRDLYKDIKFSNFAYLTSVESQDPDKVIAQQQIRIFPITTKLSTSDRSQIILVFPHSVLKHGECYSLKINDDIIGVRDIVSTNTICMTKCQCNIKGMKSCDESIGTCTCHSPFTGDTCSQCEQGYVFDAQTNDCLHETKCKQDGGAVDCNGHGTCYTDNIGTGGAKCDCDPGYSNDGIDLCAKCSDPIYTYPNCHSTRQWVIEQSDHDCDSLPTKMPTYLYKNQSYLESQVYQSDTDIAYWYSVYKLNYDKKNNHRTTEHFFKASSGILRLFLDTHNSGVRVKFSILDPQKKVVHNSGQHIASPQIQLIHLTSDDSLPFTLLLSYEIDKIETCPKIEILFVFQPLDTVLNYLKCSTEELKASQSPMQAQWNFGQNSQFSSQRFTVSSGMKPGQIGSYFISEDQSTYKMVFKIQVTSDSGNALSIITSYSFETLFLEMSLIKSKTVIARQRLASLEDVSETDLQSPVMDQNNMMSIIEVPSIESGEYELEISVSKFLFLSIDNVQRCLNFDLMIEYVARSHFTKMNEVMSIVPSQLSLQKNSKAKIEVKFGSLVDIEDFITKHNDMYRVCVLQNIDNTKDMIFPERVMNSGTQDSFLLYFNFQGLSIPDTGPCYKVRCSTEQILQSELIRDTVGISTQYCFQTSQSQQSICNPNSVSKLVNGRCICTYPYLGPTCEACEAHYKMTQDSKGHTLCKLDTSKCSLDLCSGHGSCSQSMQEPQCQCNQLYSGKYCNRCKDSQMAYPDCTSIIDLSFYEEAFLLRSLYKVGASHTIDKSEQCPMSNYPKDLERIEFMNFISSGSFHIAEHYTVNHDRDNAIRFSPKVEGTIKILIQQPQIGELIMDDDSFDIEIALYESDQGKILASSMNQQLDFQSSNMSGKLDYAVLQFKVTPSLLKKPLYLLFRAVNFTESAPSEVMTECQEMYIEIQYTTSNSNNCDYNQHVDEAKSREQILVDSDNSYSLKSNMDNSYSVYNNFDTFFFYEDFYFASNYLENSNILQEYELAISVIQRFEEANSIDFVIEVLGEDASYEDVTKANAHTRPKCQGVCVSSGFKSFNEIRNSVEFSGNTYVRVWLFQARNDGSCANFQLFLSAKEVTSQKNVQSQQEYDCQELDLPHSLNVDRYLGTSNQNSFHYLERFRVDNIQNSTSHDIKFTISKPTLIRVVALIHKHRLEFDIELRDTSHGVKLINSQAKNQEDSIFAQLAPGSYAIRLLFSSAETHILRQHCQSIEFEMAFQDLEASLQTDIMEERTAKFSEILTNSQNDKYTQIQKRNALSTFNLKDDNSMARYKSYVELMRQRFTIPTLANTGLLFNMQSDFLRNDVSFLMMNIDTKKSYRQLRTEGSNKLLIEALAPGEYELMIYSYQCLTNLPIQSSALMKTFDINYKASIRFIKWIDSQQRNSIVMLMIDGINLKISSQPFDKEFGECLKQYNQLPETLHFNYDQEEVNQEFMIQSSGDYEHLIEYTPSTKTLSHLKIAIYGRSNTKITLFRKDDRKLSEPLFESFSINGGQDTILIANGLTMNTYVIEIIFETAKNDEDIEDEQTPCESFRMHIVARSESGLCLKDASSIQNQQSLVIQNGTTLFDMILRTQFELQPVNFNSSEITIEIDYSQLFYVPALKLIKNQKGKSVTIESQDVKPFDIDNSHKNLVRYKFSELNKRDTFFISVTQSYKPKGCLNKITLKIFKAEESSVYEKPVIGSLKTFTSQENIFNEGGINAKMLPINLDTYKYLKSSEDPYIEVSEFISMNPSDDKSQNVITFSIQKPWNNTLVRFSVEANGILMSLKSKLNDTCVSDQWQHHSITQTLSPGQYELLLEYTTDSMKYQALNAIKLTIMFADHTFYKDKYLSSHKEAFRTCSESVNLPLALTLQNSLKHFEDEQVYDYPLMRLNGNSFTSNFILDSFNFRVNETSRFYMSIGTHQITTQVQLRLNEMRDFGVAYIGEQSFSLNTIDIVLGAGDYSLQIEQPLMLEFNFRAQYEVNEWLSSNGSICGLFSFQGRITPIREIDQVSGNGLQKTSQMKCQIKEVLPIKIYKGEFQTKGGNEFFINEDSTFTHFFKDILIRKTQHADKLPEYDKVQISPPENGLLSIVLQYPSHSNNVVVKLYDAITFSLTMESESHESVVSHSTQSASNVFEHTIVFSVLKDRQYLLMLYYKGEIRVSPKGKEICDYYSVQISFNAIARLVNELQCIPAQAKSSSTVPILSLTQLPKVLTTTDFSSNRYEISGYSEVKYAYQADQMLLKTIDLDFLKEKRDDLFDIDARIKYDTPLSTFELGLYDQIQGQYEDVTVQLPFFPEHGDPYSPTLVRELKATDVRGGKKYILTISDSVSSSVMEYLNRTAQRDLCLYSEFSIKITKKEVQQAIIPMITGAFPSINDLQPLKVIGKKKEIVTSLTFSTLPSNGKQLLNEKDISQLVSLQITHLPNSLVYLKPPSRVTFSNHKASSSVTVSLTFNIEEEMKESQNKEQILLKLQVDLAKMKDLQGRQFTLDKGVILPQFEFEIGETQQQRKAQEQHIVSQADKIQSTSIPPVKCLCVHGQCRPGESTCFKCDSGWSGKRCDVKSVQRPPIVDNQCGRLSRDRSDELLSTTYMSIDTPKISIIKDEDKPSEDSSLILFVFSIIVLAVLSLAAIAIWKARSNNYSNVIRKRKNSEEDEDAVELITFASRHPTPQSHELQLFSEANQEVVIPQILPWSPEARTSAQPQSESIATTEEINHVLQELNQFNYDEFDEHHSFI